MPPVVGPGASRPALSGDDCVVLLQGRSMCPAAGQTPQGVPVPQLRTARVTRACAPSSTAILDNTGCRHHPNRFWRHAMTITPFCAQPTLSVIIPTHNREIYLAQAIESALRV